MIGVVQSELIAAGHEKQLLRVYNTNILWREQKENPISKQIRDDKYRYLYELLQPTIS